MSREEELISFRTVIGVRIQSWGCSSLYFPNRFDIRILNPHTTLSCSTENPLPWAFHTCAVPHSHYSSYLSLPGPPTISLIRKRTRRCSKRRRSRSRSRRRRRRRRRRRSRRRSRSRSRRRRRRRRSRRRRGGQQRQRRHQRTDMRRRRIKRRGRRGRREAATE